MFKNFNHINNHIKIEINTYLSKVPIYLIRNVAFKEIIEKLIKNLNPKIQSNQNLQWQKVDQVIQGKSLEAIFSKYCNISNIASEEKRKS